MAKAQMHKIDIDRTKINHNDINQRIDDLFNHNDCPLNERDRILLRQAQSNIRRGGKLTSAQIDCIPDIVDKNEELLKRASSKTRAQAKATKAESELESNIKVFKECKELLISIGKDIGIDITVIVN